MLAEKTRSTALNGICPYFTMFPLEFPYTILQTNACKGDWVADPFCGRGTTNYASRILGLPSFGIDSSPVAAALAQAKLASTSPARIMASARHILEDAQEPKHIPKGEFWEWAYHPDVLQDLCRMREAILSNCDTSTRIALRAIIMGALHGPLAKSEPSYFSNQSPRTYAPKPKYAVKFWRSKNLRPKYVDLLKIIEKRAIRYYDQESKDTAGIVIQGDSRNEKNFSIFNGCRRIRWVITSPPYYGMRTYLSDQWIRRWFLGGPDYVDYKSAEQIEHSSPDVFALQLNQVWKNISSICTDDARLIIRFGAINDRKVDPMEIVNNSFVDSGWRIEKIEDAGTASNGKRQANQFKVSRQNPISEHDIWAIRN